MNVSEIMTREFETVREDSTLLHAMRHLQECPLVEDEVGIKCVVILDREDRIRGVLTQSDVVGEILFPYFARDLAANRPHERTFRSGDYAALAMWAAKVRVKTVMTVDPVTIRPDATNFEAADLLITHKVKSLPVIDDGKVVGILYRSALYRSIAGKVLGEAPKTAPA